MKFLEEPKNQYDIKIIRTHSGYSRYRVEITCNGEDITSSGWSSDYKADTKIGIWLKAHKLIRKHEKKLKADTIVYQGKINGKGG